MGLIKALKGTVGGILADEWREYFYCEAMEGGVLVSKGEKRTSKRSSNKRGEENIISNGSIIAVNEGQCMLIVNQGRIVEFSAQAGEFIWDSSTEPSIFYGGLGIAVLETARVFGRRFSLGGDTGSDQRIYFINLREIMGNKYGTPNPIPFRITDSNIGLDMDIAIRCFGEYSIRIVNPILFYKNVCGNVEEEYLFSDLESQLKSELLTALQPAFAKISSMGIRYSALPGHTAELAEALRDILSEKWDGKRGVEIVSIGINSVKASEEDERQLKELQRTAVFRSPSMAAAQMASAQAAAIQAAAENEGAGPAMAFMGMGMAENMGGIKAQGLYEMGQQKEREAQAAREAQTAREAEAARESTIPMESWTCVCGMSGNKGKFCPECGLPKPIPAGGWTCSCGTINKGKFCMECGKKKPQGIPQYRCDKCGWEPEDMTNPPKFCPECGDPFDDGDIV